jgi:DNA-binding HxlR family transcriptional regulator
VVTKSPQQGTTRKRIAPPEPCPLDATLQFLGNRWVPKILWYLCEGPMRFGELKRALDGVSSKVLTERLRTMEEEGVVIRTVLPTSPPQVEYALTRLGLEFRPVFEVMVTVGAKLRRRYGIGT